MPRRVLSSVLVMLAACAAPTPPAVPPEPTAPPPVATEGFVSARTAAVVPMSVPELRAFMLERPLLTFLEPTENVSPPRKAEVLSGTWSEVGAVRRLRLTDGHYVIERVLEDEPELFRYQVWVFTNAAGRGVDQIIGEQRFVALGPDETRYEWDYNIKPKNTVTRVFVRRLVEREIQPFLDDGLQAFAAAAREEAARRSP